MSPACLRVAGRARAERWKLLHSPSSATRDAGPPMTSFVHSACRQPVPSRSPCPDPGPAEETRAARPAAVMNRELAMAGAAIARTGRQLQHASPARTPGRTDRTLASPSAPLPCPGIRSPSRYRLVADCAVPVNLPPARRALHLTQCPQQPQTAKDEPRPMITTERRVPVNDAGDPAGPACPDGRCSRSGAWVSPR